MNSQVKEERAEKLIHWQLNTLFQNDKHPFSYFSARTNHLAIPYVTGMESTEDNQILIKTSTLIISIIYIDHFLRIPLKFDVPLVMCG